MQIAGVSTELVLGGIGLPFIGFLWRLSKAVTRLEFILTGAEGKNGIRQEVKDLAVEVKDAKADIAEIKAHLHNEATNQQTKIAQKFLADEVKPRPRRKNGGRRAVDKR